MKAKDYYDTHFAYIKKKPKVVVYIDEIIGEDAEVIFFMEEDWPYCIFDEPVTVPLEDLEPYYNLKINAETFGKLVRNEITVEDISDDSILPAFYVSEYYDCFYEDVLAGLKNVKKNNDPEDFMSWYYLLEANNNLLQFYPEEMNRMNSLADEEIYQLLMCGIRDLAEDYLLEEWEPESKDFDVLIEDFENLVKGLDKPLEKREITDRILEPFVFSYDDEELDGDTYIKPDEDDYRFALDRLAKTNPDALQKKGYLIYTGSFCYKQDWKKCRDIFEEYYAKTGDISAMNTLGYIYYYGRCNNGKPEYDKAFKCFSIGHAGGYYESTYKLGDMFRHGYGVVRNERAAYNLYMDCFDRTLKLFVREAYECKFADCALRIGNCFKDGIGVEQNEDAAYFYYLMADYAIRKRMEFIDYYGDDKVFKGIQKELQVFRDKGSKSKTIKREWPFSFANILDGARRILVEVTEYKNTTKLTAHYLRIVGEEEVPPMIFACYPEADYCELIDEISLSIDKKSKLEITGNKNFFIYNNIMEEDGYWLFFHDDILTAKIKADSYTFKVPNNYGKVKSNPSYH